MVFSLLATGVLAQSSDEDEGFIRPILHPFANKFTEIYDDFYVFIDSMIYLIIFLGLTQVSIGKLFQSRDKKAAKSISIGVALVLAVGLGVWEASAGFSIKDFGPFAAVVLMTLMGYAVYAGLKELQIEGMDKLTVSAAIYVLIYYSMQAVIPNVIQWLNDSVPIVGALLALLGGVFTFFLIYKIIMFIINIFGEGGGKESPEPEPVKPPKGDEEGELKALEKFVLDAMQAFDDMRKGCDAVEAEVRAWAAIPKPWTKVGEVNRKAKEAIAVHQATVEKPSDIAKSNVDDAASEIIKILRNKKYASVRSGVEELDHLIAHVRSILAKIRADRKDKITEELARYYNEKVLKKDANKRPSRRAHTILHPQVKRIREEAASCYTDLDVALRKIMDIFAKADEQRAEAAAIESVQ